jgi:hypothetical protein
VGPKADDSSLFSAMFKNEWNCKSIPAYKFMACTVINSFLVSFKFEARRSYFVHLAVYGRLH